MKKKKQMKERKRIGNRERQLIWAKKINRLRGKQIKCGNQSEDNKSTKDHLNQLNNINPSP